MNESSVTGVCPSKVGSVSWGVIKGPADHAKECGLDPVGKGEPTEPLEHECIMTPTRSWFQQDFLVPV